MRTMPEKIINLIKELQATMGLIAKLDTLSKPKNLPRTTAGGAIVILTYCFVLVMLVIYVVTVTHEEYPREVSIRSFPSESDPEKIFMPKITCVATNGCYINPSQAMRSTYGCLFLQKGESIPDPLLRLHYNADAYEYFNAVTWETRLTRLVTSFAMIV